MLHASVGIYAPKKNARTLRKLNQASRFSGFLRSPIGLGMPKSTRPAWVKPRPMETRHWIDYENQHGSSSDSWLITTQHVKHWQMGIGGTWDANDPCHAKQSARPRTVGVQKLRPQVLGTTGFGWNQHLPRIPEDSSTETRMCWLRIARVARGMSWWVLYVCVCAATGRILYWGYPRNHRELHCLACT